MAERLVTRMSTEMSLVGNEPVEVYDRAFGSLNDWTDHLRTLMTWWEALPPVLRGFLASLSGDRLDPFPIDAFADWLEENGQTEAGQRVRLLRPEAGDVLVLWIKASAANVPYLTEEMRADYDGMAASVAHTAGLGDRWVWVMDQALEYDVHLLKPEHLRAAGWVREDEAGDRAWDAANGARLLCAALAEAAARNSPDQPHIQRVLAALAEDMRAGRC